MSITDLFYGLVEPPRLHRAPAADGGGHHKAWPVRLAAVTGGGLGRLLRPRRPRS
jgi:hypothetical protein